MIYDYKYPDRFSKTILFNFGTLSFISDEVVKLLKSWEHFWGPLFEKLINSVMSHDIFVYFFFTTLFSKLFHIFIHTSFLYVVFFSVITV